MCAYSTSSQGSAASPSGSSPSDSRPSGSARSKHSPEQCLPTTGPTSPSTTTCGPSQPSLFPGCEPRPSEASTSSAEDSPARTSRSRGKGQDSAGPDRGFGASAPGLWGSLDPVGHCLRMSVLSSSEALTGCARIWRATATPSGRFWWVLASASERPTEGTESGSWPTARAEDSESAGAHVTRGTAETLTAAARDWATPNTMTGGQTSRGGDRKGELLLGGQVRRSWTTPTQDDAGGRATRYKQGGTSLSAQTQRSAWPTATSRDCVSSGAANYSTESGRHSGTTLTDAANGLWATPAAADHKNCGGTGTSDYKTLPGDVLRAGLLDQGSPSTTGKSRDWPTARAGTDTLVGGTGNLAQLRGTELAKGMGNRGSLNSRWVAQLMGYPSDWCASSLLDTASRKLLSRSGGRAIASRSKGRTTGTRSKPTATRSSRKSSPSSARPSSKRTGSSDE